LHLKVLMNKNNIEFKFISLGKFGNKTNQFSS